MNLETEPPGDSLSQRPIRPAILARKSIPARSPMAPPRQNPVGANPRSSIPARTHGVFAYQLTITQLNPLQSTLTKNLPLTPLQSILTKTLDLKSPGINTYKKTGGRGCECSPSPRPLSARLPARGARAVSKSPARGA